MLVQNLSKMTSKYHLGDAWFVVSCGWWQRVVERGETPTNSRIRNADIVDAARSCRCCSRSILNPNLMEDVDYRLVSERVWNALSMEFGYDWAIRREVVSMGRRLGVDVYPAGLEERATGHDHAPNAGPVDTPSPSGTSPPTSPQREDWSPEALEQWRAELKTDQVVDALDTDSKWYEATIVGITDAKVKVHYRGWSSKWDEWLNRSSPRLMPLHSRVRDWRKLRINDELQVGDPRPGKKRMRWRDAKVVDTRKALHVQIQVDDELRWMDAQDEHLCPPGTHRSANAPMDQFLSPTSVTTMSSKGSTPISARKRLKTSSNPFSQYDD